MQHLDGKFRDMKKVFIGTPAYEGKVHVQYLTSMVDLCKLLELRGYTPVLRVLAGGSLLVADRNRILQMFWETEADYAVLIDSDLGFDPAAVIRLIDADKELSGGVYPSRDGASFNFRPILEESGKIVMCPDTLLLKMSYIPAGFMVMKRSALEKMRNCFPELYYSPKYRDNETKSAFCLFNTEVFEGEFWGEDYVFCRRVREAEIDIWVDPLIPFNHAGVMGSLISALTIDPEKAIENYGD